MLDTHEKVKNALSNGAEEALADPEVTEIGDTPMIPLLDDDHAGFKFGPVKPATKMPKYYIPTFGKQAPEAVSDEFSDEEPAPPKKKRRCVLCCPHPFVHTLALVIVQTREVRERFA
jgi:hypothetical protein